MLKKNLSVLLVVLCALLTASAQNKEDFQPVTDSSVLNAELPSGALLVAPSSVPAEINQGLEKIVAAGEGKLTQGASEVLAWSGNGYTKARAKNILAQLENNLSAAGWKYEVGGTEGEVTFFTVLRETPARRAVVGFFVPDTDGLVVAWTEVLSADSKTAAVQDKPAREEEPVKPANNRTSGGVRELTGKWERKQSGMSSYSNGAYQGSSGNYESYTFSADGRVEYTSLIAVQNYGCRLEAFTQSKGRASVDGGEMTIDLGAGTIKRDDSCSRSKNYTKATDPSNFTYQWTIEKDEYGTTQLVLTESNGNKYYYRRAQ